ncbi:MAG: DUF2470 domain-containing protein, partial [Trebonia sp.]
MSDASANPFSEQVITAVATHMNMDHLDSSLRIVQVLGGRSDATSAKLHSLDGEAVEFEAVIAGSPQVVRVPWQQPISERGEIRVEIERMNVEACTVLG